MEEKLPLKALNLYWYRQEKIIWKSMYISITDRCFSWIDCLVEFGCWY